jgi:hypothetical protein
MLEPQHPVVLEDQDYNSFTPFNMELRKKLFQETTLNIIVEP